MKLLHLDPSLLSALATLVIGSSVAVVSLQQWRLARHKFRLDLFEKRYKVYEATAQFLSIIMAHANFHDEDLRSLSIGTRDAIFLFPKRITGHIYEIRRRALAMRLLQTQFEGLPVGEQRSKLVEQNHTELTWLLCQMGELASVFKPYLGFATVK